MRRILLACTLFAQSAEAGVIYQAFDQRWTEVAAMAPRLAAAGYSHIQVSPPQASNPCGSWYCRYQPYDFTQINGYLGTEGEFAQMARTLRRHNLELMVDVVFNHMSNHDNLANSLHFPYFSPQDFHPRRAIGQGAGDETGWLNGDLPDLRTESPYVRQQAKAFLHKLVGLGASGFRFDAAKHIERSFFEEVLSEFKGRTFSYGEVLSNDYGKLEYYSHAIDVTDFKLLETIVRAFSYGGDLRLLHAPERANLAMPGPVAVTFVRTHDIALSPQHYSGLVLSDPRDSELAMAYVLAREDGFPFVYRDDAFTPTVLAGVRFHETMLGNRLTPLDSKAVHPHLPRETTLFLRRGESGLAIINKGGSWISAQGARMPGMAPGWYRELQFGFCIKIDTVNGQSILGSWNDAPDQLEVGPRTALFIVQDERSCGS